MLKKIAVIGGIVAVAGLGVGGAAWAESNTAAPQAVAAVSQNAVAVPAAATLTTSAVPSSAASTVQGRAAKVKGANAKHPGLVRRLEKVSHAQWVSKDGKTGSFVTHDAARGTVSAVSGSSITIRATDGTLETFVVDSATKVHVRGSAKEAAGSISQVKVGDRAGVLGTGTGTMTATRIVDRGVPKAPGTATSSAPTTS